MRYKVYTTYLSPTTRGLTTLVKSRIPSKLLPSIDCGTEAETLNVQIYLLATTLTVHNIYKTPAKSIEAEALFAAASDDDSIIAGDFNAHHQFLNSISETNQTGRHLYDLLQKYPDLALLNNVTEATHLKGGYLDLTFLSIAIQRGSKWQLHPLLTYDHFTIEVKLELEKYPLLLHPQKGGTQNVGASVSMPQKKNSEKKHADAWYYNSRIKEINARINKTRKLPRRHRTDELHNLLVEIIKHSVQVLLEVKNDKCQYQEVGASVSIPQKKNSEKKHADAWYYNSRIKEMNARIKRTRKLLRRHRTDELHNLLEEIIKHSVQVSLGVKIDKWYSWCNEVNFSTSLAKIWVWFNKVSGKYNIPRVTQPDPLAEAKRNNIVESACNIVDDSDPYTKEELNTAPAKGRKDTAPRADLITYSMLRNMGNHTKLVYLHFINRTHTERLRPTTWNQQDTKPIPKPKKPDTYRPIASISCTEKVAQRMALSRMQWKIGQLHHPYMPTEVA
ncbi:uncharacterized protein [Palaemon carinicauda]|uniref:uncharacterized protein n=1 Tax=Palaemon carinicauda TaxID=392227 RepID=UPI0035B5E298